MSSKNSRTHFHYNTMCFFCNWTRIQTDVFLDLCCSDPEKHGTDQKTLISASVVSKNAFESLLYLL